MTIEEMHYDFKMKINKVDSWQNRNFLVPEIDFILNEAQELFVKLIAFPRLASSIGLEQAQRDIIDIQTLIVSNKELKKYQSRGGKSIFSDFIGYNYCYYILPDRKEDKFWYLLRGTFIVPREICGDVGLMLRMRQHDDLAQMSVFDKSSYKWREINCILSAVEGKPALEIILPDDLPTRLKNDTADDKVIITYIRKPQMIYYASGYYSYDENENRVNGYTYLDGTKLTGKADCELPEHVHREIVDLAVMLASNQIQDRDYANKVHKLSVNQLINNGYDKK